MKKILPALSMTMLVGLTLFAYQNCARGNGNGSDSIAQGIGSKGNGDSYEGKTKEFAALDHDGTCGRGSNYARSIVRLDALGNASIVRRNCVDIAPEGIPTQDYEVSVDAPEVLTMNGALFEEASYLAATSDRGVWACRTNLKLEDGNSARITIRILTTRLGGDVAILSYSVLDPGKHLLSVRRTGRILMTQSTKRNSLSYQDSTMRVNDLSLEVKAASQTATLGFQFKRDPNWSSNTESAETKDHEVLQPLGKFQTKSVNCYGNERPVP